MGMLATESQSMLAQAFAKIGGLADVIGAVGGLEDVDPE